MLPLKNSETKSFIRFLYFTRNFDVTLQLSRSHAARLLPGFIVDNHKTFLVGVGGGAVQRVRVGLA